jgi:glycine/D-amino acid oxidase-like deaminating enzyme
MPGLRAVSGMIGRAGRALAVRAPHGTVTARKAAPGTNAFRRLVRRVRLHTVPVYDYVLVTEPLSAAQRASVGWRNRQGGDGTVWRDGSSACCGRAWRRAGRCAPASRRPAASAQVRATRKSSRAIRRPSGRPAK